MPLDVDVRHIARLARLKLSDDELERLGTQLPAILEAAARVGEVAADDVPPTSHPIARSNVLRPDEPVRCLTNEEALSTAPEVEDGRFKVPPIVETE